MGLWSGYKHFGIAAFNRQLLPQSSEVGKTAVREILLLPCSFPCSLPPLLLHPFLPLPFHAAKLFPQIELQIYLAARGSKLLSTKLHRSSLIQCNPMISAETESCQKYKNPSLRSLSSTSGTPV